MSSYIRLSTNNCDVLKVGIYSITYVYKPLRESWEDTNLFPTIFVGHFNSHYPNWEYDSSNKKGDIILDWASHIDFRLVHDPNQTGASASDQS